MKPEKLDLNLLTVFMEVYRLRSITQAADALNLTQPAVSNALKRLKLQVGNDLFVRDGRGIAPTSTGEFLAQELEPQLRSIRDTLHSLEAFDPSCERRFKVLLPESMMLLLREHLPASGKIGNCTLEFILAPQDHDELMAGLSLGKFDLAIELIETHSAGFVSELVHEDELVVLCDSLHPRISQTLTAEQYLAEAHIGVQLRRAGVHVIEYYAGKKVSGRRVMFETSSVISMYALMERSEFLGGSMRTLALKYADKFSLAIYPFPFESQPITHYLTYHRRTIRSPAQQWLLATLRELIGRLKTGD